MFCENWKHRQAPPSQTEQTDRPLLPKISNTHTEWGDATLSQKACGEKIGVSNYEAYSSGNLPHIPKLTTSSHIHHFGIRNPKNQCFVNVILQIIYSALRTTHQKCIPIIVSQVNFQNAYSIHHIKHLVHKKWEH